MKKIIKNKLPVFYQFILHLKRKIKIIKINKIKKLSKEKQIKILEKLYKKNIGHNLDWKNLNTYTEKMQWEKIYDNNPLKIILADKYRVRKWIEDKIGKEYLIPIYGVWKKFDDIEFDKLPEKFVLKTNHGSGTNYIIKDKSKMNKSQLRRIFNDWMKIDYAYCTGFEMHYSQIKPLIIAEKFIESEYDELQDYKFLCFDGKPYYCWVDMNRYSEHTRNVYDLKWNLQPWNQNIYGNYEEEIPKPQNFEKMIKLATSLCAGFSHVRVDLYNVKGKIYFGEMTFTNGSGLDPILPEEYDRVLGDLWNIDTRIR